MNPFKRLPWNRRYACAATSAARCGWCRCSRSPFYTLFHRVVQRSATGWSRTAGPTRRPRSMALSVTGARTLLETVITMNLSFVVFTFGSLLVAIQVAGGQYTPRIIATTLLRDNVIRVIVGVFVFTLAFAVRVLAADRRDRESARRLRRQRARRLLDHGVPVPDRLRRPAAAPGQHRAAGRASPAWRVIQSVYPDPTTGARSAVPVARARGAGPDRRCTRARRASCWRSTSPASWRWPAAPTG